MKCHHQSSKAVITTAKHVNFYKIAANDEELNAMVKKAVSAALKEGGGKKKYTHLVAVDSNAYRKEEAYGIYRINLAEYKYKWQCEG